LAYRFLFIPTKSQDFLIVLNKLITDCSDVNIVTEIVTQS